MKELVSIQISQHAVDRYRERVGELPTSDVQAKIGLFRRLMEADRKHFKNLKRLKDKRTTYIPSGDCMFIISLGTVVTVLSRADMDEKRQALAQEASA